MSGDAGTRMPEHDLWHEVEYYHCGTYRSGWLNGNHPTENDQIVDRQVCFANSVNSCYRNIQVQVIKCDTYFLYKLDDVPYCFLTYCSE